MTIVGAFARVDLETREEVCRRINALSGVSTFDLETPEKVGLLIEADGLDPAHHQLTKEIKQVEGVLGVWPVYVNDEPDDMPSDDNQTETA